MYLQLTSDQMKLRDEICTFLEREVTNEFLEELEAKGEGEEGFSREFSYKLAKKGWLGVGWPKEYGGQGFTHIEQCIFQEEMSIHRAPGGAHWRGVETVGPTLILFGTEEQKKNLLPRITSGEIVFAVGYTESGSGSDAAALQTHAVEDGDDFIVNGEKMFTSVAQQADYVWTAARTNPNVPKHKGISVFMLNLHSPGVKIRPVYTMAAGRTNQVFLDDVRVPRSDMVGEKDQGWYVLAASMDIHRSGIDRVMGGRWVFDQLVQYLKEATYDGRPLIDDPMTRNEMAELDVEFHIARMLAYRIAYLQTQGKVPTREISVAKIMGSELQQHIGAVGMRILGMQGRLERGSMGAPLKGAIERLSRSAILATIGAGTGEIQRNIISQRALGLPRSW